MNVLVAIDQIKASVIDRGKQETISSGQKYLRPSRLWLPIDTAPEGKNNPSIIIRRTDGKSSIPIVRCIFNRWMPKQALEPWLNNNIPPTDLYKTRYQQEKSIYLQFGWRRVPLLFRPLIDCPWFPPRHASRLSGANISRDLLAIASRRPINDAIW